MCACVPGPDWLAFTGWPWGKALACLYMCVCSSQQFGLCVPVLISIAPADFATVHFRSLLLAASCLLPATCWLLYSARCCCYCYCGCCFCLWLLAQTLLLLLLLLLPLLAVTAATTAAAACCCLLLLVAACCCRCCCCLQLLATACCCCCYDC